MVDSRTFRLTVDAIGSLQRDVIHEIGSSRCILAAPLRLRVGSRVAFFKPCLIDNLSTDLINRRVALDRTSPPRAPSFSLFFLIHPRSSLLSARSIARFIGVYIRR
jgi:hypothetical protein